MTTTEDRHAGHAAWAVVATTPVLTAELAADAVAAMEFNHTRYLDDQKPAARRIATVMAEMGRFDLAMRAELVLASITIRQGALADGARLVEAVLARAESLGDAFASARAHYSLAWVAYFLGDRSGCQIHATRSVELLPGDAAPSMQMDHLMILAISCDKAPEGQQYYDEAVQVAARGGDPSRTIMLHNNIAYSALERGDSEIAAANVEKMLRESERSGVGLAAVHLETVARAAIQSGNYRHAVEVLEPVRRALDEGGLATDESYYAEPHALAAGLMTLAIAHRHLGEWDRASDLLRHVRRLADERDLGMFGPQVLEEEARIHAARGEFADAFHTYEAFHQALMAQQSEEQLSRARLVQASFNADRSRRDAERFRQLAMRDALTGLYNRRYLDDLLVRAVADARESGEALSLAIADADFFKRVNDSLSHEVGDAVLRDIASILVSSRPSTATVCRLGGEEFVVVLPGLDGAQAWDAAEAMRRAISEYPWVDLTGSIPITVSIGVTTVPAGRTSPAALLSEADRNLYAAKRSGRNRVMGDPATVDPETADPGNAAAS